MGPFVDLSISSNNKKFYDAFLDIMEAGEATLMSKCVKKVKKNRTTLQTLLEESTIRASRRHLALPPC